MELIPEKAIERRVASFRKKPRPLDAPQLLLYAARELIELGIRGDVAEQAVRLSSEDGLLALVEHLPEWQQQALLDLATGKSIDDIRMDYGVGAEPTEDPEQSLRRAVTRMTFVRIEDDD